MLALPALSSPAPSRVPLPLGPVSAAALVPVLVHVLVPVLVLRALFVAGYVVVCVDSVFALLGHLTPSDLVSFH